MSLKKVPSVVFGPVLVVQLHKLHRIGSDVDGKVANVRQGVRQGLEEDDGAGDDGFRLLSQLGVNTGAG